MRRFLIFLGVVCFFTILGVSGNELHTEDGKYNLPTYDIKMHRDLKRIYQKEFPSPDDIDNLVLQLKHFNEMVSGFSDKTEPQNMQAELDNLKNDLHEIKEKIENDNKKISLSLNMMSQIMTNIKLQQIQQCNDVSQKDIHKLFEIYDSFFVESREVGQHIKKVETSGNFFIFIVILLCTI